MIDHVFFMSESHAAAYAPDKPTALISITGVGSRQPEFEHPFVEILRAQFHDFKTDDGTGLAFTADIANTIVEFVARMNRSPANLNLAVHCKAGSSRSSAVAQWAAEYVGTDVRGIPSDVGTRLANPLVLELLRATPLPNQDPM
jgi:predicted protein tyrosine phosphatase